MNTDTNVTVTAEVTPEANVAPTSEGTTTTTPAPKPAAKKAASAKPTQKKAAAPKKAATKKPAPKKATTPSKGTTATAKPVAKKKAATKPNPSASYIGFTFSSTTPHTVNYRQGKKNIVECKEVTCTGANATGRRLNVKYTQPDGKSFERRVYKEYFEKAAQVFGAMLPE